VDITFADPKDVPEVNSSNCFNSSVGQNDGGPMGFNFVYTATGLTAGSSTVTISWTTFLVVVAASIFASLM
jgi:hypothetical protein